MRTVGTLPVLMVAVFGSAPANAQQRDGAEALMAQRVEFGFSRNHRGGDTLPAVTYRLTGALDRDRFLTDGTGLEWRVGARTTLSATFEAGGHDARDSGPHFVMFGIKRRFGRH
jgi:hypothetical protein